ncbi:zinc finger, CCHC-type containing protein [Tanacetum coccineum]|uniref:Zinc finger, CCHC-type containing protein n=1 Tax=Tanacetum coccineum TaxID=301880 RepID=A0ABQ4Y8K8_9ASTR
MKALYQNGSKDPEKLTSQDDEVALVVLIRVQPDQVCKDLRWFQVCNIVEDGIIAEDELKEASRTLREVHGFTRDVAFWKEAVQSEIDSIMHNDTWELTDLPPGCKALGYPTVKFRPNKGTPVSQLEYSRAIGCLYVFLLGGGAISWASKKQTCITSSTMESEFMALAAAGNEAEWLRI